MFDSKWRRHPRAGGRARFPAPHAPQSRRGIHLCVGLGQRLALQIIHAPFGMGQKRLQRPRQSARGHRVQPIGHGRVKPIAIAPRHVVVAIDHVDQHRARAKILPARKTRHNRSVRVQHVIGQIEIFPHGF